jgi:uncharacterized OsmC-like protein/alpha-beta hydrolase superfamily lysophospholipase
MATERVSFPGAYGDELAARVDLPVHGAPRAWVLFAHCFTCSKNLRAVVRFARELNREGIGVLRFDFTGLGESEGDFADTNFTSNVEDLVAAAGYMEREWGAPDILVGHSLGGAAVLHAAHSLDSVKAVATIGAPADPAHVLQHVSESRTEIDEKGEAEVTIEGRPFRIQRQFLEDLEATRMKDVVGDLGRALLILHSPQDQVVGVDNAARLYTAARHPKSFVSLHGADHLLMEEADSRYAARVLATWASRYVDLPTEEVPEPPIDQDRVVVRIGEEGFRSEVWTDGHYLIADEPRSVGGTDEGATPYGLLLAGLGSCTVMTLRMYADRKGWGLDEARVALRHRRRHANDEEDCEEGEDARLDVVDREIELLGELSDEQRTRLLEIAEKCPVHRTLDAGVKIRTQFLDRDPA